MEGDSTPPSDIAELLKDPFYADQIVKNSGSSQLENRLAMRQTSKPHRSAMSMTRQNCIRQIQTDDKAAQVICSDGGWAICSDPSAAKAECESKLKLYWEGPIDGAEQFLENLRNNVKYNVEMTAVEEWDSRSCSRVPEFAWLGQIITHFGGPTDRRFQRERAIFGIPLRDFFDALKAHWSKYYAPFVKTPLILDLDKTHTPRLPQRDGQCYVYLTNDYEYITGVSPGATVRPLFV